MKHLFDASTPRPDGFRDVHPEQLSSERVRPRIVDVREASEFHDELGHIRGAELVPLGTLGATSATWDRGEEIVVVCRSGRRSEKAAQVLASVGFARVMNLAGGMMAWNAARLPVE